MMDFEKICWPGWDTVRLIGRGSFGAVYEIQRQVSDTIESAALKVISIPQNSSEIEEMYGDGYNDESITATFQSHLNSIIAEYTMMRKLDDCVNIVRCDDVRYVQHDNGIGWDIFIKMELLTPLTKALPTIIPEKSVIELAKDICTALDMCSKNHIIHRDIKPQNIFVSKNGKYKLGDFGIAKTVEKTSSGTKIGTYKYMAPEVYHNQPYGNASDLYSLGLVLYWMLNNRRLPFLSANAEKLTVGMEEEARERRLSGEPIPAPACGSPALQQIVLKACAFHPADRYQTAAEMLQDLNALLFQSTPNPAPFTPPVPIPVDPPKSAAFTPPNPTPADLPNATPIEPMDPYSFDDVAPKTESSTVKTDKNHRKGVALGLALIPYTGLFGIHDFYLGNKSRGFLKLCTINFLSLGWFLDMILMIAGKYKDSNGEYL